MTYSQSFAHFKLPKDKTLILFDGYCNLCNAAVVFILKRDKKEKFYFASLSWPIALEIKKKHPAFAHTDSILVYQNGKVYDQSSAALKIAGGLRGLWPLLGIFWIVPKFLRDALYRFIAKNRYKWFGKRDTCMIPNKDVSHRFLE